MLAEGAGPGTSILRLTNLTVQFDVCQTDVITNVANYMAQNSQASACPTSGFKGFAHHCMQYLLHCSADSSLPQMSAVHDVFQEQWMSKQHAMHDAGMLQKGCAAQLHRYSLHKI